MTREEANKRMIQACKRTWNEKTCKEIFKALEQEPKILDTIDFAIDASNGDTNYFVGFRNGLRYAKSLVDGEEPQYESCAEQEPTETWSIKDVADAFERHGLMKEQEPCEDEYIKVPKKALKYRTAGMVAYNAEWLKNHFDIERAVICGVQQPCEDAISRQAVMDALCDGCELFKNGKQTCFSKCEEYHFLATLPSVNPQKSGEWIQTNEFFINKDG